MPTRAPVHGTAKLWVTISVVNHRHKEVVTAYEMRRLQTGAVTTWRLTKTDGESFDVWSGPEGHGCTCPDFVACREGTDPRGCKHCLALKAVGLL